MSVNLLCINSGSSSLKFALYQLAEAVVQEVSKALQQFDVCSATLLH